MKSHDKSKRFLASALITTGLLGSAPLIGNEVAALDASTIAPKNITPRIDVQLVNQQFQCAKTGFILRFLTESKALFIRPDSSDTLRAAYTVHFNQSIAMNVYQNRSEHFDIMMHGIQIRPDGFSATINGENRYFQKV